MELEEESATQLAEDITLSFYDNSPDIKLRNLTHMKNGGQARIYRFIYGGRAFLLKAILRNDRRIFRTINGIRLKLTKQDLPQSIRFRTLPIGQGCCDATIFGSAKFFKFANIFVFNYLNGISLSEFLPTVSSREIIGYVRANSIDKFEHRKQAAIEIAAILALLEANGIVHGDLYDDNWLVNDENQIHLIDIEGSGILKGSNWEWEPLSQGKIGYLRPAEDVKEGKDWIRKTTVYTDRWDGTNLIFRVLTGINNPFFFMRKIDPVDINRLITDVNLQINDWVPTSFNPEQCNPALSPTLVKLFLVNLPESVRVLFFNTFITGYNDPNSRTTFEAIYRALKESYS